MVAGGVKPTLVLIFRPLVELINKTGTLVFRRVGWRSVWTDLLGETVPSPPL